MLAHGDGDFAEMLAGGPIKFHVPARHRRVDLRRRGHAARQLELGVVMKLRHLVDAGTGLGGGGADVATESNEDMPAHATRHGEGRALNGNHRAGATVRNERREMQIGDPEVIDEVFRDT